MPDSEVPVNKMCTAASVLFQSEGQPHPQPSPCGQIHSALLLQRAAPVGKQSQPTWRHPRNLPPLIPNPLAELARMDSCVACRVGRQVWLAVAISIWSPPAHTPCPRSLQADRMTVCVWLCRFGVTPRLLPAGATAHFATAELDAGPIIDQAVTRITHRDRWVVIAHRGRWAVRHESGRIRHPRRHAGHPQCGTCGPPGCMHVERLAMRC